MRYNALTKKAKKEQEQTLHYNTVIQLCSCLCTPYSTPRDSLRNLEFNKMLERFFLNN